MNRSSRGTTVFELQQQLTWQYAAALLLARAFKKESTIIFPVLAKHFQKKQTIPLRTDIVLT